MAPRQSRRLAGLAANIQELPPTRPRKKHAATTKTRTRKIATKARPGPKPVMVTAAEKKFVEATDVLERNPTNACAHKNFVRATKDVVKDSLNSNLPKANQPRTLYQSLSAGLRASMRRVAAIPVHVKEPLIKEAMRFAQEQGLDSVGWKLKYGAMTCLAFYTQYHETIHEFIRMLRRTEEFQRAEYAVVRGGLRGAGNGILRIGTNWMNAYRRSRVVEPDPFAGITIPS